MSKAESKEPEAREDENGAEPEASTSERGADDEAEEKAPAAASKDEPEKKAAPDKKASSKSKVSKKSKGEAKKASRVAREATSERPAADVAHSAGEAALHAHGHHKPNRREYVVIFAWLFVLTILEVGVAYTESVLGKTALVTALIGLALTKAACVALFYMHLKHETRIMRWTVALPMLFPALYAFILIAEGVYRSLWGGA